MKINNYSDLENYTNIYMELLDVLSEDSLNIEKSNLFFDKYSFIVENFLSDLSKNKFLMLNLDFLKISNISEANDFYYNKDLRSRLELLANYLKQVISSANIYELHREDALRKVFFEYPNIVFLSFRIFFTIKTRLYANIIYELLDNLPKDAYRIENTNIDIIFNNENNFVNNLKTIIDIYHMTRKWSSFKIIFNNLEIDQTIFHYLYTFLGYNQKESLVDRTKEYKKKKTINTQKTCPKKISLMPENKIDLSAMNYNEILDAVVEEYKKICLENYTYEILIGKNSDRIIIIENQVIVYFVCDMKRLSSKQSNIPCLTIQELTYNEMFKFNFAAFCRKFYMGKLHFDFLKFKNLGGKHFFSDDFEYFNFVDKEYPKLELKKRYDQHPGILYHFLIISIVDENSVEHYGVGYTTSSAYKFFLKICNELLKKNHNSIKNKGINGLILPESMDFLKTFLSFKGMPKIKRLEDKISYFIIDKHIKTDAELIKTCEKILLDVKSNKDYVNCEKGYYKKPQNRWKTEEMVYNIIHNLYGNHQVIYQYKPYFLRTSKGQLSYDIYICGLKIAIEYQGQQHFYPVDYFGGAEHFESQQKRDALKKKLSKDNSVSLIYINYYDDITPDFIKSKIEEILSSRR